MKWKLSRGKWRPRLQAFVDELPGDAVVKASTAAFAALAESAEDEGALRAAVNAMTTLKVPYSAMFAPQRIIHARSESYLDEVGTSALPPCPNKHSQCDCAWLQE